MRQRFSGGSTLDEAEEIANHMLDLGWVGKIEAFLAICDIAKDRQS